MTALYMDGFDHYGQIPFGTTSSNINVGVLNMLDGNWAQVDVSTNPTPPTGLFAGFRVSTPSWGLPRTGSACLVLQNTVNPCFARKILPSGQTKLFLSFGFALDVLPGGAWKQIVIDFRDNGNTVLFSLGVNPSGQLQLWNGPQTTLNSITSGPIIKAQTWHFLEMELDLTGGSFVLRVDDATGTGTPVMNATVATGATVFGLGFGQYDASVSTGLQMYWDDLFIRNGSGSSNTGFLGDRRIATLFANADTVTSGWTPSYYKEFGAGILRLANAQPNVVNPLSPNAFVAAAASTSLDIGAADFTLETMIRFDKLPTTTNYSTIFSRWDAANNKRSYRLILGGPSFNNSSLQFDTSPNGLSGSIVTPIVYPWAPTINRWYHLALVRAAGELLLFVDGQQLGLPIADSSTYFGAGSEVFSLGAEVTLVGSTQTAVANTSVAGRYDETRFTNGIGRYTATFTPPTLAFPRGAGGDPDWADVVLLCGYDSGILDESSFARTLTAFGGAVQFTPSDGSNVGVFSTVNKPTPDDNTFIAATLVSATNTLTMITQPANGNTVTVGTKDGTTAAVYTFKTTLSSAFDILIDTSAENTLLNLMNAINTGAGAGTKYGTGTTVNFDVNAVQLPFGQIAVVANTAGTAGNSIPSTATGTAASWATTTLTGGQNIPGPTDFKFQRPPANTTIISALQTTIRALKTDAGLGTVQTALIGPLGGSATGAAHALAVSPDYYNDIIEIDPDTSGPISPTTIINGQFQINRTA